MNLKHPIWDDYEKVMSESAVKVADILSHWQENQADWEQAFAALGYKQGEKK